MCDAKPDHPQPTVDDKSAGGDEHATPSAKPTAEPKKAVDSPVSATARTSASDPDEHKALAAYLQHMGLGKYVAEFEGKGITSLKLLKLLGTHGDEIKSSLKKEIGNPLVEHQIDSISADDIDAWTDAKEKLAATGSEAQTSTARQQKLSQALSEVEALREACDKDASSKNTELKGSLAKLLDASLARFREEGLGSFPSIKTDAEALNEALKRTVDELRRVSTLTTEAVEKKQMSAIDLIYAHQLLRGRCIDAHGTIEAPGGALLDLPKRATDADLFGPALESFDFSKSYQSDTAMTNAERILDTHSSSFSTSTRGSGAAFMGSGVGAMSFAVNYAQALDSRSDTLATSSNTTDMAIQTRYHWSPMRQIVFSTEELELSSGALSQLRTIHSLADEGEKRLAIRDFLCTFGSHVFGRITLGGWYKYTARSTATGHQDRNTLEQAVAQGMDWAVSVSASYAGLSGIGKVGEAVQGKVSNTRVVGREYRCEILETDVNITTTTLGGTDGLPREEWLGSLHYAPQWRVIQREVPVPVWKIIARDFGKACLRPEQELRQSDTSHAEESGNPKATEAARTDAAKQAMTEAKKLAALFEKVWVQEVFIPSLVSELSAKPQVKAAVTARELEDALKDIKPTQAVGLAWSDREFPLKTAGRLGPVTVSLAIFRNQLCCVVAPVPAEPTQGFVTLHYYLYDGTEWRETRNQIVRNFGDTKFAMVGTTGTPGMIHMAFVTPDSRLYLACGFDEESDSDLQPTGNAPERQSKPFLVSSKVVSGISPAVACFKDKTYVFYVREAGDGKRVFAYAVIDTHASDDKRRALDVKLSADETAVGNSMSSEVVGSLSATVFNGSLYCAYRGPDNRLYLRNSSDGVSWSAPVSLTVGTAVDGPALGVFGGPDNRNRLYCVYRPSESGPLFVMSSFDGSEWSAGSLIGGEGAAVDWSRACFGSSPAIIAFSDQGVSRLYCFYVNQRSSRDVISYRVASYEPCTLRLSPVA